MGEIKYCPKCDRFLSVDDFNKNKRTFDGLFYVCKQHQSMLRRKSYYQNVEGTKASSKKRDENRKEKHKAIVWNLKVAGKCVDCGNNEPQRLEFDHINPATKKFNISDGMYTSTKALLDELKKCVLRCKDCHIARTKRQRKSDNG